MLCRMLKRRLCKRAVRLRGRGPIFLDLFRRFAFALCSSFLRHPLVKSDYCFALRNALTVSLASCSRAKYITCVCSSWSYHQRSVLYLSPVVCGGASWNTSTCSMMDTSYDSDILEYGTNGPLGPYVNAIVINRGANPGSIEAASYSSSSAMLSSSIVIHSASLPSTSTRPIFHGFSKGSRTNSSGASCLAGIPQVTRFTWNPILFPESSASTFSTNSAGTRVTTIDLTTGGYEHDGKWVHETTKTVL